MAKYVGPAIIGIIVAIILGLFITPFFSVMFTITSEIFEVNQQQLPEHLNIEKSYS